MGFILFIVSIILGIITFPIGIISNVLHLIYTGRWKIFNNDMLDLAVSIDCTLNVALKRPLNLLLIKGLYKHSFGNKTETVSYAIGKNYILNKLTKFGHIIRKTLYSIDKNHVIKAVMKVDNMTYKEVMEIYYKNNNNIN